MPRPINLRQIEAFKALVEHGTTSRAASVINVSQPAVSKLIANFELDTGLRLFDRVKGVLVPTELAMQLYAEVDRIFGSVRQVENAIETIRRKSQGRLSIGVMPALAGPFIQHSISAFRNDHQNVFCSIQARSSQWIVEGVATRRLDLGLVEPGFNHPYLIAESFMEYPLVCIMPKGHSLGKKKVIEPSDLDQIPFISLNPDSLPGHHLETLFEKHNVCPKITLVANLTTTLCELVAAGHGVALVHPVVVSGMEHHFTIRRFEPETIFDVQLCRSVDTRNSGLIDAFAEQLHKTAAQICHSIN